MPRRHPFVPLWLGAPGEEPEKRSPRVNSAAWLGPSVAFVASTTPVTSCSCWPREGRQDNSAACRRLWDFPPGGAEYREAAS